MARPFYHAAPDRTRGKRCQPSCGCFFPPGRSGSAFGTPCATVVFVKTFVWNPDKSRLLREERGIGFEEVVFHIERGDVLDVVEHENQERYPGQRMYVVDVEGYAHLVPFVESEEGVFLKTIIPSRKATRDYLGGD